jgi:hypothetical protein
MSLKTSRTNAVVQVCRGLKSAQAPSRADFVSSHLGRSRASLSHTPPYYKGPPVCVFVISHSFLSSTLTIHCEPVSPMASSPCGTNFSTSPRIGDRWAEGSEDDVADRQPLVQQNPFFRSVPAS